MTSLHVLHLSSAGVYGGGEEHVRTLLEALLRTAREGERVSLACPAGAPLAARVRGFGIDVHELDFGGKFDAVAPLKLRALTREIGATHLHGHNRREDLAMMLGIPGSLAVRMTTLHDRVNMKPNGSRSTTLFDRVYLKLLRRVDQILAVSKATLEDYRELGGDDRLGRTVITNGMDMSRLTTVTVRDVRRERGIVDAALVVVLSARVRQGDFGKKGHLRLLEALARMTQPVHLVTVGEDDDSGRLILEKAKELNVSASPLGFVDDALPVLAAADVVVLPSLYEGLPRSLMEAMALGRPVLGSDVDGIRALVGEGAESSLLQVDDPRVWAAALDALALDPARRDAEGRRNAAWISDHFSSDCMAEDHWRIYRA